MLRVKCDGSYKLLQKGGKVFWAYAVVNEDGVEGACASGSMGIGIPSSHNAGKYHSVIEGLKWVAQHAKGEVVRVETDLELIVKQVRGEWNCISETLVSLRDEVRRLLRLTGAKLEWIPRKENGLADAHAQLAFQRAISGRTI